jgi:REP-associated tyrosine transposase
MPRPKRSAPEGIVHHVFNRGNKRAQIFVDPLDYRMFTTTIAELSLDCDMRLLAFCIMPNHFHLVVWPETIEDLSRFMQRLMTRHVREHQQRHGTTGTGHIYQSRFKNSQVGVDVEMLRACRYVEANAARAGLVERAEQWPWSSLVQTVAPDGRRFIADWPVQKPSDWLDQVNRHLGDRLLTEFRETQVPKRGRPVTEIVELEPVE